MPKSMKSDKDLPGKMIRNPFDFSAPSYDDRNKINAGNTFGVGYRQPVGHMGENAAQTVESLPQERSSKPL